MPVFGTDMYSTIEEFDLYHKNLIGKTKTELNNNFLKFIPKDAQILEVGCVDCLQLELLKQAGFTDLTGLDISTTHVANTVIDGLKIVYGACDRMPFKDGEFGVLLTNLLLSHIPPNYLLTVLKELVRCSRKYILCYERFSNMPIEIKSVQMVQTSWANNYCAVLAESFDLEVSKFERLKDVQNNADYSMFLLQKKSKANKNDKNLAQPLGWPWLPQG